MRVRELTKAYMVLLSVDEVQTGMGRTGKLWGINHWGVTPDILAAGLFRRGVLVAATLLSVKTVWIEPPLIISYPQIDAILNRLEDVLKSIQT